MSAAVQSPSERPRVLLMALNYQPAERVVDYLEFLVGADVEVEVVVADESALRFLKEDPRVAPLLADARVRVHTLMPSKHGHTLRRPERLVVYKTPEAVLADARKDVAASRASRRLRASVTALETGQQRLSGAVHERLLIPFYRVLRPYLLSRRSRSLQRRVDLDRVERIVAADISAVALGWRLAKRNPTAVATTALDRLPYAGRTAGGHRAKTAAAADPHAAAMPDTAAPEPVPSEPTAD
jgi:hypothetical protein